MAENFLTPVIESLIHLLTKEVKSFKGVRKKIETLKRELEIVQCLLKGADERSDRGESSDAVKTWVKQLREEADHIEDVIDDYRRHVAQSNTDKHGFVGFLSKASNQIKALKSRCPIASQIRDINESLRRIKDAGQSYGLSQTLGLQGSSNGTTYMEEHDPRLGSLFVGEDDEYVDVPYVQEDLKRSLIEGASKRIIISLVGQGGIGKTTLVKKVYDEVKHNFDCCAWITVTQLYDVKKLLKIMMQQMCGIAECTCSTTGENDTIQGLISTLRHALKTKRYVVVFDDVWNANFWEVMKCALRSANKGDRIIITTRNGTIASTCKESSHDVIQELPSWSPNMAWELFCKKAFPTEFDHRCPPELEKLGHEIVSKCQGLPLTIGTVAGLLSRKRKVHYEWQRVLNNLNSEFKTNPELTRIMKIISLSYHDLPYHLKSCLLYFGIFPENYEIRSYRLFELWIAEGLVQARGSDKTLEDEAKEYLNELIKRNLVLLELYYGTVKFCRVHDLIREFILTKANESSFSRISDEMSSLFGGNCRRLSIHGNMKYFLETMKEYSGVRSIFLFNFNDELISKSSLVTLSRNFKLLKVLDFEGAPLDCLPDEVGNLFNLRYLNLKHTKIKVIPKCISKLHNLQSLNLRSTQVKMLPKFIGKLDNLETLNLNFTLVQELPMEINKLRNLRHLCASNRETFSGVKIQEGFGNLEKLETLEDVEVHHSIVVSFVKDLEKLRKLKALGLSKLTTETSSAIFASIKKFNHLEQLNLATINEDEILDVEPLSSDPPPFLRTLGLTGQLQMFPHWISELWNLQALFLRFSKMIDDPLIYLKHLPNLLCLRLVQSYEGEQLHFEEGGFQKLKDLSLSKLTRLKLLKMDKGTLPLLRTLRLDSCPQMEEVPLGVQHLRNLKQIIIWNMPIIWDMPAGEFVVRMQLSRDLDYPKIQQVPV